MDWQKLADDMAEEAADRHDVDFWLWYIRRADKLCVVGKILIDSNGDPRLPELRKLLTRVGIRELAYGESRIDGLGCYALILDAGSDMQHAVHQTVEEVNRLFKPKWTRPETP